MEEQNGTRQIIGAALDALKKRESKLDQVATRTVSERAEARAFIKAIEKALGGTPAPAAPRPAPDRTGQTGSESPRGRFTQKVIDLVRDQPRTVQSIADTFGSKVGYVASIVDLASELQVDERGVVSVSA